MCLIHTERIRLLYLGDDNKVHWAVTDELHSHPAVKVRLQWPFGILLCVPTQYTNKRLHDFCNVYALPAGFSILRCLWARSIFNCTPHKLPLPTLPGAPLIVALVTVARTKQPGAVFQQLSRLFCAATWLWWRELSVLLKKQAGGVEADDWLWMPWVLWVSWHLRWTICCYFEAKPSQALDGTFIYGVTRCLLLYMSSWKFYFEP